jgi:hypothetical protein
MVTRGLGLGQMMSLQDWIILSDGAIIQTVSTTPVDTPSPAPAPALVDTLASQDTPASQAMPPAQIGSKFTWTHGNSTRIAIMTSKGLLQVKSIVNGETEIILNPGNTILKKIMFADEAAWRASLPEGGMVELVGPNNMAEPTPMTNLSDVEKVEAYMKRYKIRSNVYESLSPQERVDSAISSIVQLRREINNIPLSEELEHSPKRHQLTLELKRRIRYYNYFSNNLKNEGENGNTRPLRMSVLGKNRLWIYHIKNRNSYLVSTYNGKLAVSFLCSNMDTPPGKRYSTRDTAVKLYDSFAEFGESDLYAFYRKKTINLN